MSAETWFTTADVEAACRRLADNRYGGPDDVHDLDGEDIHEIVQIVLTATWQSARRQAADDIAHRIRRELVCCDVYDRDQGTDRAGRTHAICFWGEAGARLAKETGR